MSRRLTTKLSRSYKSFLTCSGFLDILKAEILTRIPSSLKKFDSWAKNLNSGIKNMGSFIGKECSPIVAQRAFRIYRLVHFHSRLWSNHLRPDGRPLPRGPLLSFLLLSLCQSKPRVSESILDSELLEHKKDLDFIHELTTATVVCPDCKDRLVVDKKILNVKYCHCAGRPSAYDRKVEGFAWTPFVETADLLIWRMPHPDRPGLFLYKVYGYYDDISAEDFLETQLDIEYRRKWDDTVLKLDTIESHKEHNLDVIYWEMKWPTMFSNRDYVFARRHLVDKHDQVMVIVSKSIPHISAPERKGIHRVKEYWSVMQVNAVNGISEPGVEFGLTYFDNPGVSLPGWLNNWAAMTAIPEFLDKQRNAARAKKRRNLRKAFTISRSSFSDAAIPRIAAATNAIEKPPETSLTNAKAHESLLTPPVDIDGEILNNSTIGSIPNGTEKSEILSQFFKEHVLHIPQ